MGIRHLQGVPWNIEYQQVKHDDNRKRDKRRCDYYRDNNRCVYSGMLYCCGSGKCDVYKERTCESTANQPLGKSIVKEHAHKLLPESTVVKIRNCVTNEIESHKVVYKRRELKTTEILYTSDLAKVIANSHVGDIIEFHSKKYEILAVYKPSNNPSIDKVISKRKKKKRNSCNRNKMIIGERKTKQDMKK